MGFHPSLSSARPGCRLGSVVTWVEPPESAGAAPICSPGERLLLNTAGFCLRKVKGLTGIFPVGSVSQEKRHRQVYGLHVPAEPQRLNLCSPSASRSLKQKQICVFYDLPTSTGGDSLSYRVDQRRFKASKWLFNFLVVSGFTFGLYQDSAGGLEPRGFYRFTSAASAAHLDVWS